MRALKTTKESKAPSRFLAERTRFSSKAERVFQQALDVRICRMTLLREDARNFLLTGKFSDSMITTFEQHVSQEQRNFPDATGEFTWLMSGLSLATKMIQAQVRRAGFTNILGLHGATNIQGEEQQKLDVYANECLIDCLSLRETIGIIASEENESPILLGHTSPAAKYAIVFDPLDGSSNIDVAVTIGTIFSIFRRPYEEADDPLSWVLQPGINQIAAGYVVYGSSTVLVYSSGFGVHGFTLDPALGSYVLTHQNIRLPRQGKYYSINEAYCDKFPRALFEIREMLAAR